MSKEYLEALNGLFDLVHCQDSFEKAQKYFDIIEEALQRLEAIDNANPSEALINLKYLKNLTKVKDVLNVPCWNESYEIVKQALLKAQEPNHYLKWEDLEFSYGTKTQKVRMSGTIYKIVYANYDNTKEAQLLSEDEKCYYIGFTGNYKDNVQLFNDLHLERVE